LVAADSRNGKPPFATFRARERNLACIPLSWRVRERLRVESESEGSVTERKREEEEAGGGIIATAHRATNHRAGSASPPARRSERVFHERACAFVSVRWTRGCRQWDVTRVGTLYTPWIRAGVARPREPSLAIPVEGPGGTLRIGVRVVTVSPVSQPARRAFSLGPIAYSSPLPRLSDLSIGMETVIRVSFLLRVFSLHDRHSLEICSSSSDYATDLSLPLSSFLRRKELLKLRPRRAISCAERLSCARR